MRVRQLGKFSDRDLLREPRNRIVGLMGLEQDRRLGTEGRLVVRKTGPICGAYFNHARAARRHDLGNTERPPDLYELSAGDHDLSITGQRIEDEDDARSVVVHHQRVFRRGQELQELGNMRVPNAATGTAEVELQVGVAFRDLSDVLDDGGTQRRAAKVGVKRHTRRVDHGFQ